MFENKHSLVEIKLMKGHYFLQEILEMLTSQHDQLIHFVLMYMFTVSDSKK